MFVSFCNSFEKRICIWFALELREFRELEVSLAVVDTGRDHLDNH